MSELMMYKSPIEIIVGEMHTEWENGILKTVQNYNVNCNKEELIRALAYDRDQYRKGYEDGRPKWIPCSERLPEEGKEVLVTVWNRCEVASYNCALGGLKEWNFDSFSLDNEDFLDVTAWMPLPEPYMRGE